MESDAFSVSDVNRYIKQLLDERDELPRIPIMREASNLNWKILSGSKRYDLFLWNK